MIVASINPEGADAAAPAGTGQLPQGGEEAPTHYVDLWDRIRAGFSLPQIDDPLIAAHERWFADNPAYVARNTERAGLYLYYIVEEVEKRGMPLEIALLPAIESAYRPHAYSSARALGLWQFMAPTARHYGIKINWWYDGRRDVMSSTRAALDYLQELHEEFNDWFLALAAYNAGEGTIRRQIEYNRRHHRPTDYRHLHLNRETRNYVPKLMAFVRIVAHPDRYGITLAPTPNEPHFAMVDVGSQIDLNVVAKLADVSMADLYAINPGLKRRATPPDGPHRILVPVGKKSVLLEALRQLPDDARIKWRRYHVRHGDTLGAIARRYHVSVHEVQRANHLRGTLIRAGHDLLIPLSSRPLNVAVIRAAASNRTAADGGERGMKVEHRVREGESLWSIAHRYGVAVSQIAKWNTISAPETLQVDQKLDIWVSADAK